MTEMKLLKQRSLIVSLFFTFAFLLAVEEFPIWFFFDMIFITPFYTVWFSSYIECVQFICNEARWRWCVFTLQFSHSTSNVFSFLYFAVFSLFAFNISHRHTQKCVSFNLNGKSWVCACVFVLANDGECLLLNFIVFCRSFLEKLLHHHWNIFPVSHIIFCCWPVVSLWCRSAFEFFFLFLWFLVVFFFILS